MARLKLKRSGHWQVAILSGPNPLPDVAGILIVVDPDEVIPRAVLPLAPGDDASRALFDAAVRPAESHRRVRPKSITCPENQAEGFERVARKLGAELRVSDVLPAVDAVVDLMYRSADTTSVVPASPKLWKSLLRDLIDAAPWTVVPEDVRFVVEDVCDFEEVVAVVLGMGGEQLGLAIYPTVADYENFLAYALQQSRFEDWTAFCVHLDPTEELPPNRADALHEAGLVVDGLALQLLCAEGVDLGPLEPDEQEVCLAVTEAVLRCWKDHGSALLTEPTDQWVETWAGDVLVRSAPPGASIELPEPFLVEAPQKVFVLDAPDLADEVPGLVVKLAKREALALVDALHGVDLLSAVPDVDGLLAIEAWADGHYLGVLTRLPDDDRIRALWRHETILLVISAGGSTRESLRESDFLAELPVALDRP